MDSIKSAILFLCFIPFCLFCTKFQLDPPSLPKPVIQSIDLTISKDFKEAALIKWSVDNFDVAGPYSFTLLRMSEIDSLFSIISENIPADTLNFFDLIEPDFFPSSSAQTFSVYYRLIPVDELGRYGDTSEACTLKLAQQPSLNEIDLITRCLSWYSNLHFGGIISNCRVWKDSLQFSYSGPEQILYPATDNSAFFSTCFPDISFNSGRWYYALFLKSIDARSIRIGYIDAP